MKILKINLVLFCLFSGKDIGFAGLADNVGSVCRRPSSSAYFITASSDQNDLNHAIVTFVHELGHCFNGHHSHAYNCTGGTDPNNRMGTVMCASLQTNSNPIEFSVSNIQRVETYLATYSSCLGQTDICEGNEIIQNSNFTSIRAYAGLSTVTTNSSVTVDGTDAFLKLEVKDAIELLPGFETVNGGMLDAKPGSCEGFNPSEPCTQVNF